MLLLYNLGIRVYSFLILIAKPFNKKARLWVEGRKDLFPDLKENAANLDNPVWIHAASLGEFEQGRPLIEAIKQKYPGIPILLTFFSPSGYEVRKDYAWADLVTYLPLDSRQNALKFVEYSAPRAAIFIKYEVWYHMFRTLVEKRIPVYMISAVFRPDQWFFSIVARPARNIMRRIDRIFVQDAGSMRVLRKHGFENISLAGDTRIDRVLKVAEESARKPEIIGLPNFDIVAGSTWPDDEKVLRPILFKPGITALIAPHEVDRHRIMQLLRTMQEFKSAMLLSKYQKKRPATDPGIIIVDSIGKLAGLYARGHVAYVGGGFGAGIHNILEPAAHLKPVIIGPKYEKFHEARELVEKKAAFSISGQEQCKEVFARLQSAGERKRVAENLEDYFRNNAGATDHILSYLEKRGNLAS